MNSLELTSGAAKPGSLDARALGVVVTLGVSAAVSFWFLYVSVPVAAWVAGDFRVFWLAAQLPESLIYDPVRLSTALAAHGETGLRAFVSPPSFLFAAKPLTALPLFPAYLIWTAAGLGLFLIASERAAGKISLLILLAAPAFHWAVIAGQVTLLVGALLHGGVLLLSRRPLVAGLLFAVAALLKPQAALLVPLALIAAGQWRTLLAAAAAGTAAGLLCLLVQSAQLWFAWVEAVGAFDTLIRGNGFIANGVTPAALAHSAGAAGLTGTFIVAAGALLGIVCCWHVFRRSDDAALRTGAIICGGLLSTPYALPYEAALLLPAASVLLTQPKAPRCSLPAAGIAVVFPFSGVAIALFAIGLLWAVRRADKAAPVDTPLPSS